MVFKKNVKGFIISSNLKGSLNYYKWHLLYECKKKKNVIKIWTINMIQIGKYAMYNNKQIFHAFLFDIRNYSHKNITQKYI